jgi:hypothetical protein
MIIILVTGFSKNFRYHYIGNEISQIHDLQSLHKAAISFQFALSKLLVLAFLRASI